MTTHSDSYSPYFQPNDVLFLIKHSGSIGMSWGISKIKDHTDSLSVWVNGFQHKGRVNISLNWSDLFQLEFYDESEQLVKFINDVYIDQLISILDSEIERGTIPFDEYKSKVEKEMFHLN